MKTVFPKLTFAVFVLFMIANAMAHDAHLYSSKLQLHGDLRLIQSNQLNDYRPFKSFAPDESLYGIGMPAGLDAELLVLRGQVYSGGFSDFDYHVTVDNNVELAFFAYTRVNKWQKVVLPDAELTFSSLQALIAKQAPAFGFDPEIGVPFRLVADVEALKWFVVNGTGNSQPTPIASFLRERILGGLTERRIEAFGTYSTDLQGIASVPNSPLHLHFVTIDEGPKFVGHVDNELLLGAETTLYFPVSSQANKLH